MPLMGGGSQRHHTPAFALPHRLLPPTHLVTPQRVLRLCGSFAVAVGGGVAAAWRRRRADERASGQQPSALPSLCLCALDCATLPFPPAFSTLAPCSLWIPFVAPQPTGAVCHPTATYLCLYWRAVYSQQRRPSPTLSTCSRTCAFNLQHSTSMPGSSNMPSTTQPQPPVLCQPPGPYSGLVTLPYGPQRLPCYLVGPSQLLWHYYNPSCPSRWTGPPSFCTRHRLYCLTAHCRNLHPTYG